MREYRLRGAVELVGGFVSFNFCQITAVETTVPFAGIPIAIIARSDDVRAGSLVRQDFIDVVTVEATVGFTGVSVASVES